MDPDLAAVPPVFEILVAFVGVFILVVLGFIVLSIVRSRKVLRDSGLDPLAAHAQIAARFAQGPLATSAQTLEQRLTELDDLHRRGLITGAEHDAARRAALTDRS